MSAVKLGWGKYTDGRLRHISKVPRGKKCQCVCPDCGAELIARRGDNNAHHFSHAIHSECLGETVLHQVAKQIIADAKGCAGAFKLPSGKGSVTETGELKGSHTENWSIDSEFITIASAKLEQRISKQITADIIIEIKDRHEPISVEIYVSHRKSKEDLEQYAKADFDCLEIDLSGLDRLAEESVIKKAVLTKANRYWLSHEEIALCTWRALDKKNEAEKNFKRWFEDSVFIAIKGNLGSFGLHWEKPSHSTKEEGFLR